MNATDNPLVEGCSVVNSDKRNSDYSEIIIEHDKRKKEIEEEQNNTLFRGKPIKLLRIRKDDIITENAIDASMPYIEESTDFNNRILYDGQTYKIDNFFKAQFKDYRKHAYKVRFKSEYVTYLSSSQRAKLQYHILAQHFDLVNMNDDERNSNDCEEVKRRLQLFFAMQNNQTTQTLHGRMLWSDGIERMITFGASLEVRSYKVNNETVNIKKINPYCYCVEMNSDKATYTGVIRTWEQWTQGVTECVDMERETLRLKYGDKKALKENDRRCIMSMYYQKGVFLTLPAREGTILRKYLNDYIRNGYAELDGLSGEIPNCGLSFTIDFNNDIDIVKQHDNTKHNREMGYNMVRETFSGLVGDEWTTQEIYSQGFNKGNIERFVKHGLIKRVKKGHYIRA